jgi:hypothetical protein
MRIDLLSRLCYLGFARHLYVVEKLESSERLVKIVLVWDIPCGDKFFKAAGSGSFVAVPIFALEGARGKRGREKRE